MKLVILHGWGQNSQNWHEIAEKININTNLIDLPGFGTEKLISNKWTITDYSNWVVKKINTDDDTILLGHSFGGRIAAEIASKNPKWLKALILTGAPCLYRPNIQSKLKIK